MSMVAGWKSTFYRLLRTSRGLQDYALGGEIIKLGATASKQKQDGKADNELDVIVFDE